MGGVCRGVGWRAAGRASCREGAVHLHRRRVEGHPLALVDSHRPRGLERQLQPEAHALPRHLRRAMPGARGGGGDASRVEEGVSEGRRGVGSIREEASVRAIQLALEQGGQRGVGRASKAAPHLALQQGRQHDQSPAVVEGHAGRAVWPTPAAAVAGHVVPRSAVRPHPRAEAGAVQLQEAHLLRVGAGAGVEGRGRAAGGARVRAASLSSAPSRRC